MSKSYLVLVLQKHFQCLPTVVFWQCWIFNAARTTLLWLWWVGATPLCDAQASHYSGFSCCRAQAQGHTGFSTVAPWLDSTGSIVVAHGLSCSVTCRVFSDQGSLNLCLFHWQADSLPLSHQGSLPIAFGINCKGCIIQHLAPCQPHPMPTPSIASTTCPQTPPTRDFFSSNVTCCLCIHQLN